MGRKIICERYEIIGCIGKGGMAKVYKVNDLRLKKIWAMKELIVENEYNELGDILVKSILDEIKILKNLDHPGMPRIVDTINIKFDNKIAIYIVMDFIEGRTLSSILDEEYYISEEKAVGIILEICEVLKYLHGQNPPIIYRDMKPENIMIDKNQRVKLIDFGIAREYKNDSSYDTVRLGTKEYAAPEQYSNELQSDERTDIYSLGMTILKILTGTTELKDLKNNLRRKHISNNLIKIILKCIQKKSINRYQSVEKLQKELIEYRKNDRKELHKAYVSMCIYRFSNVMLIISVFIMLWSDIIVKAEEAETYNKNKEIIKSAGNYNIRKKAIFDLLDDEPDELEYYELLLELYCEDELFDADEENEILNIMSNKKMNEMKKENQALLYYKLGGLYWNYYYYGQMGIVGRTKAASEWFQKSIEYGIEGEKAEKAQLYSVIGDFYKRRLEKMDELKKDDYLEIYEKLKELYLLESKDHGDQESVAIELLLEIVKNNEKQIMDAGIDKDEYITFMNKLEKSIR